MSRITKIGIPSGGTTSQVLVKNSNTDYDVTWGTGGGGGITGSGVANEITYWTGTSAVGSLSTAIYPSLTELSYVKGVTSSIQTQLNGKQNTLTNPVTGTGTNGRVTGWTGTNTISNTSIYYSGSNIGINGIPSVRLDVHGELLVRDNTTLLKDTNGSLNLFINNSFSGGTVATADLITFCDSGSFKFGKYSSTNTTYKTIAASDGYILSDSGDISILNDSVTGKIKFTAGSSSTAQWIINSSGNIEASDGKNIILGTTTGTKIGTSTTQKIGFFNATPVVQPSAVTSAQGIANALTSLGLLASSTISGGGSTYSISTKTTTYNETATSGEIILLGDTTTAGFTITLPSAVSNTAKITIKKIASANNLVVDGNGTQTIDGGLTATLVRNNESITLVSDNSNWRII